MPETKTSSQPMKTEFAPAERSDVRSISEQVLRLKKFGATLDVLDNVPHLIMILDKNRQLIHANKAVVTLLGDTDIYGNRPGELLACNHSNENPAGCGTAKACRTCGAVKAILAAQAGNSTEEECRIIQKDSGQALDLKITASPFSTGDECLILVIADDIAAEKRRDSLERAFFHDILNTAGAIYNVGIMMSESDSCSELRELTDLIQESSTQLMREIRSQKDLVSAESGKLEVNKETIGTMGLLSDVANLYHHFTPENDMMINLSYATCDEIFESDRALITRVLSNMIKNAIEASDKNGVVTLGCIQTRGGIEFTVHNQTFMPENIQLQVFQRSFSTKGQGRGIGTYSMKLLGEHYLHGKVSFASVPGEGTTFSVWLPKSFPGSTGE